MGHSAREVFEYTPRQIAAFCFLANKRRKLEAADALSLAALAARGKPKDVTAATKKLQKEGQ
jgi:hypothetical protein